MVFAAAARLTMNGCRASRPENIRRRAQYTTSIAATSTAAQLSDLLHRTDWIKVGLTGDLTGLLVRGCHRRRRSREASWTTRDKPTGYTLYPIEAVNYVSVHDNQDLFDTVQVKAASSEDSTTRAKRQVLAMSIVALGQGVPFFMAGDDLLRSKDMDQNSYDSGDWFNKIDWTGQWKQLGDWTSDRQPKPEPVAVPAAAACEWCAEAASERYSEHD